LDCQFAFFLGGFLFCFVFEGLSLMKPCLDEPVCGPAGIEKKEGDEVSVPNFEKNMKANPGLRSRKSHFGTDGGLACLQFPGCGLGGGALTERVCGLVPEDGLESLADIFEKGPVVGFWKDSGVVGCRLEVTESAAVDEVVEAQNGGFDDFLGQGFRVEVIVLCGESVPFVDGIRDDPLKMRKKGEGKDGCLNGGRKEKSPCSFQRPDSRCYKSRPVPSTQRANHRAVPFLRAATTRSSKGVRNRFLC
jgi:hypothetical protein